jgi:hypothetical protein
MKSQLPSMDGHQTEEQALKAWEKSLEINPD